ncbi:hypothetical protein V5785_22845, partial [Bacillus subtilis]
DCSQTAALWAAPSGTIAVGCEGRLNSRNDTFRWIGAECIKAGLIAGAVDRSGSPALILLRL